MRYIYNVLFYAALPAVLLRLMWRSRKNPAYAQRWAERFGFIKNAPEPGCLWIHAVSVGEVLAAVPLVKALKRQYPQLPLLLTTMTPTGSAQVQAQLQQMVFHVYVPYDLPGAIERFTQQVKPCAVVLMETELWPNLLHVCHNKNIPVILANARLSQRSAQGYERFQPLVKKMLNQLTLVAAQSQADGERFIALGLLPSQLTITGNIKFDIELPSTLTQDAIALRQQWGVNRPVWIAASTHEGEEEQILSAFVQVRALIPQVLLVLVPRHPERFPLVANLCRKQGYAVRLRSECLPCTEDTAIFIGDTIGELKLFYAASDVAFVGGSLQPTGGHNLLEPAVLKLPVITGPHMFNFTEITELLLQAGGLIQISHIDELAQHVVKLLQDQQQRIAMGEAGYQCVEKNRGSLQKHIELLSSYLQQKV